MTGTKMYAGKSQPVGAEQPRWGVERGSALHERAVKAAERHLEADGYKPACRSFECAAGSVDLVGIRPDGSLMLADVFAADTGEAESMPRPSDRGGLLEIAAELEAQGLLARDAASWRRGRPRKRAEVGYAQMHLARVADDRAALKCAYAKVGPDGWARYRRDAMSGTDSGLWSRSAGDHEVEAAAALLARRGFEIVRPDGFSWGGASVDLVCRDDGEVVFVKVVSGSGLDRAVEGLGRDGFERLMIGWAKQSEGIGQARLDVVAVTDLDSGAALLSHMIDVAA